VGVSKRGLFTFLKLLLLFNSFLAQEIFAVIDMHASARVYRRNKKSIESIRTNEQHGITFNSRKLIIIFIKIAVPHASECDPPILGFWHGRVRIVTAV
jgi:hypothetical protein